MTATAPTIKVAATLAGVTPATIRTWRDKGWLPDGPPWTRATIRAAARKKRGPAPARGAEAPHGTTSRWRYGCSCEPCRLAHNHDSTQRRSIATQQWWDAGPAQQLIDSITKGADYHATLLKMGLSHQSITGHRRRDPGFAARLDDALLYARDPDVAHGTGAGWKARCRCPECRAYHDATR